MKAVSKISKDQQFLSNSQVSGCKIRGMRILIIEDEIKLANAIKRALELQKYAVDVAHSGEEGLSIAMSENLDLIISDIMLPDITGLQVCEELRTNKNATPILMLTAKGQMTDKVAGLDAGADDYMVKPFSFEELFARIRALIRRASASKEPVLKIGNLTLNPLTFKVTRDKNEVQLSTKEFSILEYLMRNQGKVSSREEIVQHVWDYDANILPTTVEVHIKHLRDKIDTATQPQLIHTVRGFGYEIREK